MSRQTRWLHAQLDDWQRQGLVTAEQSDRIRQRYPLEPSTVPWGTIFFSGIGAVVIGLGVILLGAYNWHAIGKFGKLAIIFGVLAAAHTTGLWLFAKPDSRRHLGDALCVLGTMFFGAGIWLVAQIYHIEEHFPNGFLIWAIGALLMAWALPSVAQGLLATVLLAIWGCAEAWGFDAAVHWSPLLVLVGIGGLAWRLRSSLLWLFAISGSYITLLANVSSAHGELATLVVLHTAALLVAVGILLHPTERIRGIDKVCIGSGWAVALIVIFLLSFPDLLRGLLGWHRMHLAPDVRQAFTWYAWLPFALALLTWGMVGLLSVPTQRRVPPRISCALENWLLPLTVVTAQVWAIGELASDSWLSAWPFNLVLLAVAVMWMARGCRQGNLTHLLVGSLMLVALTSARYFDLFPNLAARGLVFLIVGGILFAEGFYFRRVRHAAKLEVQP